MVCLYGKALYRIALVHGGPGAIGSLKGLDSPLQLQPEPDDSGCGSLTKERFGYTWILTCPDTAKLPTEIKILI